MSGARESVGLPSVNNFMGSGRTGRYFNTNLGFWSYFAPLFLWGSGDNFNYLVINGPTLNANDIVVGSGVAGGGMSMRRLLTLEYLNSNLATSDLIATIFN